MNRVELLQGRMLRDLDRPGRISLRVTNLAGVWVRSRSIGVLPAGRHEIEVPVQDLPTQPWIVQPFLDGQPIEAPRTLRLR